MKTLILKRALTGFLIGIVIGNLIALLTAGPSPVTFIPVSDKIIGSLGSAWAALLVQIMASGIYGAICLAGVTFYDIERWPLALASVTHCVMIIACYIPVAILLDWVSGIYDILIMAGIQLAAYFIIWLILYLIYKRQVKELNEMQEQFKRSKK